MNELHVTPYATNQDDGVRQLTEAYLKIVWQVYHIRIERLEVTHLSDTERTVKIHAKELALDATLDA